MLKIHVDNLKVFVQPNTTILEACELVGVEIPRFCYYEKLSIAGNCRMCLVEVEKSPKPVVSCAMPVMVGMKIFTNTPLVKKAREGVLEFLLLNHPLDCPICDQGGECDLQDQAIAFGSDRSRFYDFKRTTEDKNVGPILKTIMTRCIHCTRCVRFASEIAGLGDLGTTARGTHTEIGTYIEKVFQSELSGNVIDLCPVGALTSKPYAFIARPWELKTVDSIDISDAIGSNIRIDYKETEIVRVLPRLNEELNEEWISNKTRFLYDGLKHQRLIYPYVSYSLEGTFFAKSWVESLEIFQKKLQGQMFCFGFTSPTKGKIVAICGVNIDLETLLSFKNFMHRLGSENISFERDLRVESDYYFNYRFNSNVTQIENADFCLLIGVNPRYEGSLLNVRLRKRFMDGRFQVASLGAVTNLTYPVNHIGLGTQQLYKTFFSDYVTSLGKLFFEAKAPIIIFGSSILERKDSLELQKLFVSLNPNVTLNLLQTDSNQTGAFELGIQPVSRIKVRDYMIMYLLGVDHFTVKEILKLCEWDCFIVYQGPNGTSLINTVSCCESALLPSSTFTEKNGLFMNTEGRVQRTSKVLTAPGLAKDDWKTIKVLAKLVGITLKFNSFDGLHNMLKTLIPAANSINQANESSSSFSFVSRSLDLVHLVHHDFFEYKLNLDESYYGGQGGSFNIGDESGFYQTILALEWERSSRRFLRNIERSRFQPLVEDFYLTSTVTRASHTLAQCSASLRKSATNFTCLENVQQEKRVPMPASLSTPNKSD